MGLLDKKKGKDTKVKEPKKKAAAPEPDEPELETPPHGYQPDPDLPPIPGPPEPITEPDPGVAVGTLADGTKFWLNGELYRKDLGPNRGQIVGTRYYKTPTTGDTWIAATDSIKLEPETRVEPY